MATIPVSAAAPEPDAQPQAAISPFGRILGMFFSPKSTFEDIVRKPSWLLPMAITLILSIVAVACLNQRISWREYMVQQIEKSPRSAQLTPDQKEQQIAMGAKYAPYTSYIFGVPAPLLVILVVTLVMWVAYNLIGGANTNFKTSLAIVSHAFVVTWVSTLLFLLVLFLKPFGTVDLDNPVATNVAAFLPDGVPKWLDALCKNIDIFSLWVLILIAIGFAATNPKKLKGSKAFSIGFAVLVAYIVVRVGIAFVTS